MKNYNIFNQKRINAWVRKSLRKDGKLIFNKGYVSDGCTLFLMDSTILSALQKYVKGWDGKESFVWQDGTYTKQEANLSGLVESAKSDAADELISTNLRIKSETATLVLGIGNRFLTFVDSNYFDIIEYYDKITCASQNSLWEFYKDEELKGMIMPFCLSEKHKENIKEQISKIHQSF